MTPLSLEALVHARQAVLRNATGLLEDALYLMQEQRAPRAFALTVLGREELGKLAMVIKAAYAVAAGEPFDWNRLERRMRSHAEKLKTFALVRIIYATNVAGKTDPKGELLRLVEDPINRRQLDEGKQDGLYVSVLEDRLLEPSEVITEEMSWDLLHVTRRTLYFFQTGERTDPNQSWLGDVQDIYGKIICLAEDLILTPGAISLPR